MIDRKLPRIAPSTVPKMTWSTDCYETSIAVRALNARFEEYAHSQPTRNHLPMAARREDSTVRYMDMDKNGNAIPSFAADSAERICRKLRGTCFIAYFPPVEAHQFQLELDHVGLATDRLLRHK